MPEILNLTYFILLHWRSSTPNPTKSTTQSTPAKTSHIFSKSSSARRSKLQKLFQEEWRNGAFGTWQWSQWGVKLGWEWRQLWDPWILLFNPQLRRRECSCWGLWNSSSEIVRFILSILSVRVRRERWWCGGLASRRTGCWRVNFS